MAIPETGQLVEVRRRQWVTASVEAGTQRSEGEGEPAQHLVALTALDEDSHGETLTVVWELEPGARVIDTAGLPDPTGWDPPERLEAFLDAVRWGAVASADRNLLQAPFRSGIEIQSFQLDPLVRALDMARANLLIADDVGLGKTIEAGLVIQELLIRHRARTVLIVVPAALQVKWMIEMRDRFGLDFRIIDTAAIKELRRTRGIHANPWISYPRLIASVDWMKSGEGLRLLREVLPQDPGFPRKFDILVVDEAHNIAPVATKNYIDHSQRTKLIRLLSPHFEHRLFLSATPHNGNPQSFTWLLHLLDPQRFMPGVLPSDEQRQRVVVRRLKTDPEMVKPDGSPLFPRRRLEPLPVPYTAEEREIHALLKQFTDLRTGIGGGQGSAFIHKLLKKRLFSSPRAFHQTLLKHRDSLGKKRDERANPLEMGILRRAMLKAEEEYADDREAESAQDEAVAEASARSRPLTADERRLIDRMIAWANKAANQPDAKALAIIAWLEKWLRPHGKWNDERVIIFTEYRATHAWIQQILVGHGFGGERVMTLDGGTPPEEREQIKAAFQAPPDRAPVRILLATDAASEGIDLQNHCRCMIHLEIPWNPNVLEQRNGRIDRHGQRHSEVLIWHPVGSGFDPSRSLATARPGDLEGDLEFLLLAARKVEQIREDLGSVGPVLAAQVEQVLVTGKGEVDTSTAGGRAAKTKDWVKRETNLRKRIDDLHTRLMDAKEAFQISPERVERAVQTALDLAGKPRLIPIPSRSGVFRVPDLDGSWGQELIGLEDPFTKSRRPITFDHVLAAADQDVVLFHLGHRLVQRCVRLLRAQVWSHSHSARLHRVTVRAIPQSTSMDPIVIIRSRLVITGGDHHRLHEAITMAGGWMRERRFTRIRVSGELEQILAASSPTEMTQKDFDDLADRFRAMQSDVITAVEDRSEEIRRSLIKRVEDRRDKEIADIETVLGDLSEQLRKELGEWSQPVQTTLWGEPEREALQRDLEDLKRRLDRIPSEKSEEVVAIRRRYSDLTDRTFPVTIQFLVPERSGGAAQ